MCNFNFVELIGNLGKDPEKVESKNKDSQKRTFVKLNLATNKKYKNAKGEMVTDTQWHTVYLNNKTADFALNYMNKGDTVMVIGELRHNRWIDKKGIERFSSAVYARQCEIVINKSKSDETKAEDEAAMEALENAGDSDCDTQDDIPF